MSSRLPYVDEVFSASRFEIGVDRTSPSPAAASQAVVTGAAAAQCASESEEAQYEEERPEEYSPDRRRAKSSRLLHSNDTAGLDLCNLQQHRQEEHAQTPMSAREVEHVSGPQEFMVPEEVTAAQRDVEQQAMEMVEELLLESNDSDEKDSVQSKDGQQPVAEQEGQLQIEEQQEVIAPALPDVSCTQESAAMATYIIDQLMSLIHERLDEIELAKEQEMLRQ